MALLSNMSDNGFKDCIANNIPSRAFRYATESKNVLSTKGAMYVGTGIKRTTTMMLDDGETPISYDSYITAVLRLPDYANGVPLRIMYATLKYEDGSNVYVKQVDDGYYLASSTDEGATTYSGLFPCWDLGTSSPDAAPVLIK